MNIHQTATDHEPQPNEKRKFVFFKVFGCVFGDIDERLLKHITRIDPSPQATVESNLDHSV